MYLNFKTELIEKNILFFQIGYHDLSAILFNECDLINNKSI